MRQHEKLRLSNKERKITISSPRKRPEISWIKKNSRIDDLVLFWLKRRQTQITRLKNILVNSSSTARVLCMADPPVRPLCRDSYEIQNGKKSKMADSRSRSNKLPRAYGALTDRKSMYFTVGIPRIKIIILQNTFIILVNYKA